jgi:hypothetical protein
MAVILMILGFMWWWPLGLMILALLIAGGRVGCWHRPIFAGGGPMGCWSHGFDRWDDKMARMQAKMDRVRAKMDAMRSSSGGRPSDWWGRPASSGNRAFDDYRAETLQRLEEEQREFKEFLERLRFAKDRAEFDQFMSQRRSRPQDQEPPPQPQL